MTILPANTWSMDTRTERTTGILSRFRLSTLIKVFISGLIKLASTGRLIRSPVNLTSCKLALTAHTTSQDTRWLHSSLTPTARWSQSVDHGMRFTRRSLLRPAQYMTKARSSEWIKWHWWSAVWQNCRPEPPSLLSWCGCSSSLQLPLLREPPGSKSTNGGSAAPLRRAFSCYGLQLC